MGRVEKIKNRISEFLAPSIGVLALSTALAASGVKMGERFMEESGKVVGREALEQPMEQSVRLRVGTWNMHSEASRKIKSMKRLIEREGLHVLLLQEVTRSDYSVIARNFKDWSMQFVMADKRQDPVSGGLGNLMMARTEKITDVDSAVFEGDMLMESIGKTTVGMVKDLWSGNFAFEQSRNGLFENRSAVAGTVQFSEQKYRIITSHIARRYGQAHPDQLEQLTDFIKDNTSDDYPTIFCGDLNSPPRQVFNVFARKLGYISMLTGATSVNSKEVLDYCFSHDPDDRVIGRTVVNYDYKTDHYPVIWKQM